MTLKDIYNIKRETIRDRNWVMPFGKFKGLALSEIIENDPQYLVWLVDNTDLDFHSEIMDEAQLGADEQQRQWQAATWASSSYGDNRNAGGGYWIWDDASCHPGDPFDYGY